MQVNAERATILKAEEKEADFDDVSSYEDFILGQLDEREEGADCLLSPTTYRSKC